MELLWVILTGINVALACVNTYWAYQRTCYNRDTYEGSVDYWNSWKKRAKNVVRKVLEEMNEEDLISELKKRKRLEKRERSKRTKKRNSRTRNGKK